MTKSELAIDTYECGVSGWMPEFVVEVAQTSASQFRARFLFARHELPSWRFTAAELTGKTATVEAADAMSALRLLVPLGEWRKAQGPWWDGLRRVPLLAQWREIPSNDFSVAASAGKRYF